MTQAADIIFEKRGAAGVVTLNRQQALNAVSHDMVLALRAHLDAWSADPSVTRIVLTAAPGRAFSAGGDIRALYDLGRDGRHDDMLQFWRDEYPLNLAIKTCRKPYIALIDGIVMGGGVGISVHGSHRVAGDRYSFAMPEVGIGFFPDVGATWFLPRMPGELGTYCALTGDRLGAADACATGLATHRVASSRFPDLLDALCGSVSVDAILAAFSDLAGEGPLSAKRDVIDRLFAADRVETILDNLDREAAGGTGSHEWAAGVARVIRAKSPTSLKIALRQMRDGRGWDFAQCMAAEFRIVSEIVKGVDFYEGVRAAIIDKDNAPHWSPASLDAVNDADIARYFDPAPSNGIVLT